jgi:3-hydroxybutyryl-CoA dehydrogenase
VGAQGSGVAVVGVVGAGTMGAGIAQLAAAAGARALLHDPVPEALERGLAGARAGLEKWVAKGRADATATGLLAPAAALEDLAGCGLIVEAAPERLELKRELFARLGAVAPGAVLASNTSSISITELAASTKRADRFVGLHFFNPVPLMQLVEVVRTITTAPAVFDAAYDFGKKLGKTPVRTSDKTGFIVNRLLVPYLLDAIRAYEEGVGSIADIDVSMKLGCGYPMGPFTLLDFVGLDTTYYITHVMFDEFKEPRFASPALLKRMVMAGWYGKKSGKGFYDWSGGEPKPQDAALRAVAGE